MKRKLVLVWAVLATALLLLSSAVLLSVLLKPDIWLNKKVEPRSQQQQIRAIQDSVDELESCVGGDFWGSSGLGSGCNDSLSSQIEDVDARIDDACDQIYRKFSDSPGC